jgi:hypothetical protein
MSGAGAAEASLSNVIARRLAGLSSSLSASSKGLFWPAGPG